MILKTMNVNDLSGSDLITWFLTMPEERQERYNKIRDIVARKCGIAADHLARASIADYLLIPLESVQILHTEAGKPYVEGNPCYFSLSHSGETVVCAVSDKPIGVDVERIRPIDQGIAKKICTEEEFTVLNRIADQTEQNRFLLQIWTRKEAIFKIEGALPRKDREIDTLNPAGISIQTQEIENYLISIAEKHVIPECCS